MEKAPERLRQPPKIEGHGTAEALYLFFVVYNLKIIF